jgi:hypothetical protein
MRKETEDQIDLWVNRVEASFRVGLEDGPEASRRSRENTERYKEVRREVIMPAVTEFVQKIRARNWTARCNPDGADATDPRTDIVVLIVTPPAAPHRKAGVPLLIEFRLDSSDDAVACYDGPKRKVFGEDTPCKRLPLGDVSWDRIEEYLAEAFVRFGCEYVRATQPSFAVTR